MGDLFAVYSAQMKLGMVTGRATLTNSTIATIEDALLVERRLLDNLKASNPREEFSSLFLLWWKELSPTPSSRDQT